MTEKKKQKSWTIIIIGENKQIGSFAINKTVVVRSLILILVLVLAVVIVSLKYVSNQRYIQNDLRQKIIHSEKSESAAVEENKKLSRKVVELEDALAAAFKETPSDASESDVTTTDQFNKLTTENFHASLDTESDTLHFKFLLRNKTPNNVPVSGYVFGIFKPDYLDSSTWQTFPKAVLINGAPEKFTQGESFYIARFKTIRGSFTNIPRKTDSYFISIWIFSDAGNLVLIKDFHIGK